MSKMLKFNEKALKAIHQGVKTLSRAVMITLGPRGRNVVINQGFSTPLSTKDGVTVAKEINLKDKFENMGAQLVKEASSKTADIAGDAASEVGTGATHRASNREMNSNITTSQACWRYCLSISIRLIRDLICRLMLIIRSHSVVAESG